MMPIPIKISYRYKVTAQTGGKTHTVALYP
jgi:hypothetical protein